MKSSLELKEKVLKESETEVVLKAFLRKISTFMGEEYTALVLSQRPDIVESLNQFSYSFQDKESKEIEYLLIRNAILSNISNYYIDVIKEKMKFGEYNDFKDALLLIEENYAYRKSLTKALIQQSNKTDEELYERLHDNTHVIEELDNLRFFENNRKEVEKERVKEFKLVRSK